MLAIPTALRTQFKERLLEKAIPRKTHWFFVKWLRYYLDFCKKYDFPDANKGSLAPFVRKLQEKKQTRAQQRQAADAVALYLDFIGGKYPTAKLPPLPKIGSGKHAFSKDVRESSVKEAPFPWLPWPSIWRKRIADCRASPSFVPIDRLSCRRCRLQRDLC